ncbi:primosomal protein N' [Pelotomaculum isophthalicicum JI]|uniref:Replication restart protein PriA n=1 Tax=Pelotomaculum isophthalicicum JI TaxID=947010 RepID=A0A9X4H539_9FIRM|nr:primosomal protein N' [Pelotomaculum isophthalicicum]MDF9408162.1 primosomal protein N' [Pelotomaculum isophthalicicum JI]
MKKIGAFAEVIVALNTRSTDRVFHYAVPAALQDKVEVGIRVLVPFNNRSLAGYVTGFGFPENTVNIKEIAGVLDAEPVFTPELLELARWMAENYLCSTAEALQRILSPRLLVKGQRVVKQVHPAIQAKDLESALNSLSRAPKQAALLKKAMINPGLTRKELAVAEGVSASVVDTLVEKGLLVISPENSPRRLVRVAQTSVDSNGLVLNDGQKETLDQVARDIRQGMFKVFLLHGITGSGKTEVYMQAISITLGTGRQAVVLVPEISLTPQMVDMFRRRFGGQVAVLHSALSGGERYDEWRRIKEGEASVVLGTRSAIFAPLPRPGLFVIDEEHESSYKQDDHLRYHAREVAIKRAQIAGAVVLLGSATPSLESQLKASAGGPYQLLKLTDRIDGRPLPLARVVDMRLEMKGGNSGIFSRTLVAAVNKRLDKGEQVLLFLNRRGYATFIICRECGLVLKCPRCDISLIYHRDGRLRCHYCNYTVRAPDLCPSCGSQSIKHFGAGTQKVEEEARQFFPEARLLRMDSDSTARKGSHSKIINAFRDRQVDILIGTQMIAKGLDFPGVTLVGVINADTTLHMPDFRAAERTFQLLTQVAGRAGRGELPGEAIIQTYNPDHYSITAAAAHDCDRFYLSEMPVRRSLGYPPFSHLARLLFTHEDEEEVKKGAGQAKETLKNILAGSGKNISVLGPAPAPLSKIKDRYRWQLVIKASRRDLLRDVIRESLSSLEKGPSSIRPVVNVDINPQGMM